jgi:hypothetical protein
MRHYCGDATLAAPAGPTARGWYPGFLDYLFLAFNTSTAFRPHGHGGAEPKGEGADDDAGFALARDPGRAREPGDKRPRGGVMGVGDLPHLVDQYGYLAVFFRVMLALCVMILLIGQL